VRQLRTLGTCAAEHGDGVLHLTSRANVQIRGLRPGAQRPLVDALADVGLFPSPTHERVRNYLASPASGYFGGRFDVRELIAALDSAVCSRDELANLPGRFLFAIDDGRGDVAALTADVCWQALESTDTGRADGRLLVGGVDTGLLISSVDAVEALVCCAAEFLRQRVDGWRVWELGDATTRLRDAVLHEFDDVWRADPRDASTGANAARPAFDGTSVGVFEQHDGRYSCVAAPPFGELSVARIDALTDSAASPMESDALVMTPWRTVVLPNIPRDTVRGVARRLADVGFGTDPTAGWLRVSACVGKPGCAKAHADVRARAAEVMPSLSAGDRMHFAGCERRCGAPGEQHIDVLATERGYQVDGVAVPAESLTESLSLSGTEDAQREG